MGKVNAQPEVVPPIEGAAGSEKEHDGICLAPAERPSWWVKLHDVLSKAATEHEEESRRQRNSAVKPPAEPRNWMALALEGSDSEFAEAVTDAAWAAKEPSDIFVDPDVREFMRAQRLVARDQAAPDDLRRAAKGFLADVGQAIEHGGDGLRTKQSPGQPKRDILKILPLHTRVMLCMEYERIGHAKGAMEAMRALEVFLTEAIPMGPSREDGEVDRVAFSKNDAHNLITKWWIPIKSTFKEKLEAILFPRGGSLAAGDAVNEGARAAHDLERRLLDLADTDLLPCK